MERDEKYDPQDLEQLMEEKSFVQLLDDERAFVLKHMSGEAEYEQVREVMFALKDNISRDETIAPKPELRRELIATFKVEQKKGYRYWLNSIGALFLPQQGRSNWAPALRLASVVLLVGAAWFTLQTLNPVEQELAELNETDQLQRPNEKKSSDTKELEETAESAEPVEKEGLANNNYAAPEPSIPEDNESEAKLKFEEFRDVAVLEEVLDIDEDMALEEEFVEEPVEAAQAIRADADAMPAAPNVATKERFKTEAEESISREIQSKDYVTGVTANALYDGQVELAVQKERSKSRSLAQDAALVSLLVQAY